MIEYKITWTENLTQTELEILLKEWEGYFEIVEMKK